MGLLSAILVGAAAGAAARAIRSGESPVVEGGLQAFFGPALNVAHNWVLVPKGLVPWVLCVDRDTWSTPLTGRQLLKDMGPGQTKYRDVAWPTIAPDWIDVARPTPGTVGGVMDKQQRWTVLRYSFPGGWKMQDGQPIVRGSSELREYEAGGPPRGAGQGLAMSASGWDCDPPLTCFMPMAWKDELHKKRWLTHWNAWAWSHPIIGQVFANAIRNSTIGPGLIELTGGSYEPPERSGLHDLDVEYVTTFAETNNGIKIWWHGQPKAFPPQPWRYWFRSWKGAGEYGLLVVDKQLGWDLEKGWQLPSTVEQIGANYLITASLLSAIGALDSNGGRIKRAVPESMWNAWQGLRSTEAKLFEERGALTPEAAENIGRGLGYAGGTALGMALGKAGGGVGAILMMGSVIKSVYDQWKAGIPKGQPAQWWTDDWRPIPVPLAAFSTDTAKHPQSLLCPWKVP